MSGATKRAAFGAIALLATLAGSACSSTQGDAGAGQSEDQAGLRTGNVDHAAIVEASTIMLVSGAATLAPPVDPALDSFNESDPFDVAAGDFQDVFASNLAKFDAYDGKVDWTDDQTRAWTTRIASGNYLVVDVSKPCDFDNPHTYLEIERATLTGNDYQTCGGRMPNEDALDVTVNFLMRGPAASVDDDDAIHDGVDEATTPASPTFPYLAEMNGLL